MVTSAPSPSHISAAPDSRNQPSSREPAPPSIATSTSGIIAALARERRRGGRPPRLARPDGRAEPYGTGTRRQHGSSGAAVFGPDGITRSGGDRARAHAHDLQSRGCELLAGTASVVRAGSLRSAVVGAHIAGTRAARESTFTVGPQALRRWGNFPRRSNAHASRHANFAQLGVRSQQRGQQVISRESTSSPAALYAHSRRLDSGRTQRAAPRPKQPDKRLVVARYACPAVFVTRRT
jgi:hypothetical protein